MEDVHQVLGGLHQVVRRALRPEPEKFEETWDSVERSFLEWLIRLPAAVSPLSRDLELLRRISDAFASPQLRNDSRVLAIVLDGAAKIGDEVQAHPGAPKYRVLDRKVADDFTILYTIQDERGAVSTFYFAD